MGTMTATMTGRTGKEKMMNFNAVPSEEESWKARPVNKLIVVAHPDDEARED